MTNSNDPITLTITIIIWAACILFGIGICSVIGSFVGTFLGWMIATSMDANILTGGRVGKLLGKLIGGGIGASLGIYGALQASAYIAQIFIH